MIVSNKDDRVKLRFSIYFVFWLSNYRHQHKTSSEKVILMINKNIDMLVYNYWCGNSYIIHVDAIISSSDSSNYLLKCNNEYFWNK